MSDTIASKGNILIVDDDQMIRSLVQSILESEGYNVTSAADGTEGIKVLDQIKDPSHFLVAILDMMMPGMHGLDMLTRMKLHSHTSALPVIMLTAEKKPEDLMAGYSTGADYYITKPFTRQQLLFGLNLVLGAKEA